MFKFDRTKFFDGYRKAFGPLDQEQTDGLTYLLDAIERDTHLERITWPAYMLATVRRETANTFQPIHEYGGHAYFVKRYGSQTAVGKRLGNETPEDGATYAGVGDVQLTGKHNFEKAEDALREQYPELVADFEARTGRTFDLTVGDQPNDEDDPANAGDPAIAYAIMSYGMRTGMFTGEKLDDYLDVFSPDYVHARRIINSLDHAAEIAGDARRFEAILTHSLVSDEKQDSAAGLSTVVLPVDPASTSADDPAADPASPAQPPIITGASDFAPEKFTAFIPQINTAKSWIKRATAGTSVGAAAAVIFGLPQWLQIGLFALLVAIVIGAIVIFAKYHDKIFAYVTAMNTLRADSASHDPEISSETPRS